MSLVTFYTLFCCLSSGAFGSLTVRALISVKNLSASASLPTGALTLATAYPTVLLFPCLPKIIEITPYAVRLRRDFNPQGNLPLRLSSSSATQSITFTTCHLPPNLDLLLEALQSQETSCLALLHDLFGFFVDPLALLLPFGVCTSQTPPTASAVPLCRVKPNGMFKTLPKDIYIAIAIPLWHPHQLVHKEGEVCGPGEVPGVQPAEAVWEMALAEALFATAVLGGGG
jgi:hypothetical protein